MNQAVVNYSQVTVVAARGCAHTAFTLSHLTAEGVKWAQQSNLLGFALLSPRKVKEIKSYIYFKETFMLQINQEIETLKVLPQP